MPQTKKKPDLLGIGVWILGGLCLTAGIVLLVLLALRLGAQPLAELPEEPDALSPSYETAPEETTLPEIRLLNLPEGLYTPEDFAIQGDYMACTAGRYRLGIDVSSWQKTVDWQQVKEAGMEFAILRLAWRGNTEGGIQEDDYARENYQKAKEAGLDVGGYFFSQAVSVEEAEEEAEFLLAMIDGWEMDMPIVFDWERSENRTADVDARTVTDCAKAFCRKIEEAGYEAMVYFNLRQAYNEMFLEELTEYGFWLAQYNDTMTFPYHIDMWQYTSTGSVPGIGTSVDINLYFEYYT